jgi:uncharacterized phage-associated protein
MLNFLFKAEPKVLRFRVDLDRCIEGIHYIADLKPGVTQYYIGKIFYFADKAHFLDWGRPISGDRYIAMEHGPAPSTIYDLLKEGAGEPDEIIDALLRRVEIKSDGNKRRVYSRENGDFPHLSGTDKEYLRASVEKYGSKSFAELKRLAHQEPAYVEAEDRFGLNNEMNLIRWAEELDADPEKVAAHVEEQQFFKRIT